MLTWRRRNDRTSTSGDGNSLAYLRQSMPGVLCYYAPCAHSSTLTLFNARSGAVAYYCSRHGRRALREYTQALQADHARREIA